MYEDECTADSVKRFISPSTHPPMAIMFILTPTPVVGRLVFWTSIRTARAAVTTRPTTTLIPATSPRTSSDRYNDHYTITIVFCVSTHGCLIHKSARPLLIFSAPVSHGHLQHLCVGGYTLCVCVYACMFIWNLPNTSWELTRESVGLVGVCLPA